MSQDRSTDSIDKTARALREDQQKRGNDLSYDAARRRVVEALQRKAGNDRHK